MHIGVPTTSNRRRIFNLINCHFIGGSIAALLGLFHALRGCNFVPHIGFDVVLRGASTNASPIQITEPTLGTGMALLRSLEPLLGCLGIVLWDSFAFLVHESEVVLGFSDVARRRGAI